MSGTTLALTIDTPVLGESLSWNALESCMVDMSHQVPARALALALEDAQERLIEAVCGRRWRPVPGAGVPFACPGCGTREGYGSDTGGVDHDHSVACRSVELCF